jgi:hypothetical protein
MSHQLVFVLERRGVLAFHLFDKRRFFAHLKLNFVAVVPVVRHYDRYVYPGGHESVSFASMGFIDEEDEGKLP